MRQKKDAAAGVIVFHRDGECDPCRFLLLLSRLTKRPIWEFPKGGIDPGESVYEAALRELEEETGLHGEDIRIIPEFERKERYRFMVDNDGGRMLIRKQVTYYLAQSRHRSIKLSPNEASEYEWVELSEAVRRVRYRERRRMLKAAAKAVECKKRAADTSAGGGTVSPRV